MNTAKIITDVGLAYIKALGNPEGPHPLACEWVGTKLAEWFGLPTLEFALMRIDSDRDEIPFFRGGYAETGMAFVTRATPGRSWSGGAEDLDDLVNPEAISWLVVFDTWILNRDRFPPDPKERGPNYDNVFLAEAGKNAEQTKLLAIDHTHCFSKTTVLDRRVAGIDRVKDDRLYGLFPAFKPLIQQREVESAVARLGELTKSTVEPIVASIPRDWQVDGHARNALTRLICERADFVASMILEKITSICSTGMLFGKFPK